jgi:hypothetical protein
MCFLLLILPGNFDGDPSYRERSCYQLQWYHDPTREFTVNISAYKNFGWLITTSKTTAYQVTLSKNLLIQPPTIGPL